MRGTPQVLGKNGMCGIQDTEWKRQTAVAGWVRQAVGLSVFGLLMFGFEAQLLAERSISARCCFVGDSRGGFGGAGQVSIGFVLGSTGAGAQVVSGFVISGCGGFTV